MTKEIKKKRRKVSYHAQIPLEVKENLILPDRLQLGHISGEL